MKSIMYHYVQEYNDKLKNFSFLHFKNFEKQILYFKRKYNFFNCNELFEKKINLRKRIFLTFDDGLSCHYKYVFQILKKNKLNGIFYIPTLPFEKQIILDVHKIHLILGRIGPQIALNKLKEIHKKNKSLFDDKLVDKYNNKIYLEYKSDTFSQTFKSYLNYFIKPKFKKVVINKIFREVFGDNENKICKNFYLSEKQIKKMVDHDMIIGSHSVSHNIMSELSLNNFKKEIDNSFKYINQFSKLRTFSYPYGGYHSFNKKIENHLDKNKVSFSVNVESRDIKKNDFTKYKQRIPRYDCNEFVYGNIHNKR